MNLNLQIISSTITELNGIIHKIHHQRYNKLDKINSFTILTESQNSIKTKNRNTNVSNIPNIYIIDKFYKNRKFTCNNNLHLGELTFMRYH